MLDDEIVWDPLKNEKNIVKHNISFEEAIEAFEDSECITDDDISNSIAEDRYQTIGKISNGAVILVAFTILQNFSSNNEVIRVISARKATRQERKRYESQRNHWKI